MITEPCQPPDWDESDASLEESEQNRSDERETFRVALAERVDYLMIAASALGGAQLTPQDAKRLRRLCSELELTETETEQVLASASARRLEEPTFVHSYRSEGEREPQSR